MTGYTMVEQSAQMGDRELHLLRKQAMSSDKWTDEDEKVYAGILKKSAQLAEYGTRLYIEASKLRKEVMERA